MLTTGFVDGIKVTIDAWGKEEGKIIYCALGHRLVAKKGKKVVHHFAHYPGDACDKWRKGMTFWHAQWQKIVVDKANIEVCLGPNGEILGNSTFRAFGGPLPVDKIAAEKEGHIADIICPQAHGRPLIVEIQHSSMDQTTMAEREKYYQNLIWLFDLTPRSVSKGKHNKVAMVDGKLSYLKEKVSFAAFLSSSGPAVPSLSTSTPKNIDINNNNNTGLFGNLFNGPTFDQVEVFSPAVTTSNHTGLGNLFDGNRVYHLGDECLESEPTKISGLFVVIHTRTKYWFDAQKPTYFDCGYGILRLLQKLDKGFALTLLISYSDFFRERMPPLDKDVLDSCDWFHDFPATDLLKMGIVPKIIDVGEVKVCRDRVVIQHRGCELQELGLQQGMDEWHGGKFYSRTLTVQTTDISGPLLGNDLLLKFMNDASSPIVKVDNSPVNWNSLFLVRLRKFLGASSALQMEIQTKRGGDVVIVHCSTETYGMKDKFKTLEMGYRKGVGKSTAKKLSGRQSIKQTHNALEAALNGANRSVSTPTLSNSEPTSNPYYTGKVKDIDLKLTQLQNN